MGGSILLTDVALAQTNDMQVLQSQIRSIRLEIADLQRMVFKGEAPETLPSSVITPAAQAPTSDQIGQLQGKLLGMEEQLRDLTGNYEVLENRARRMDSRLDKLITDIDFRLSELERKISTGNVAKNAEPQSNTLSAPAGDMQPTTIISSQGTEQAVPTIIGKPNSLGTLTESQLQAYKDGTLQGQQTGGQAGVVVPTAEAPKIDSTTVAASATPGAVAMTEDLPETEGTDVIEVSKPRFETPEAEYKAAYASLLRHDFDGAEVAMQQFIDGNPEHVLIGNAMYWLGETYYARKQYSDAANAFAKTYEHDQKGRKAPDSLLKLGMSLSQLGQGEDACVTYSVLLENHKNANPVILKNAEKKQISQNCPPAE